jgi:pyridoxal phosphate enzyme (YggS family)
VVVTKSAPLEVVRVLADLGVEDVGENRIQQASRRFEALGHRFRWHVIGHLQRNKVTAALEFAHLIHSVDSVRLLDAIERRAHRPVEALLEVNVSGEASKHGFTVDDVQAAAERAATLENVRVTGLMTMAPIVEDEEQVRPIFRALHEVLRDLNRSGRGDGPLRHLSMGMTQDYRVAVEEGATLIRVGSAIFEGVEAPLAGEG